MEKNAQKTQFKIGRKNWLKHNMKAVLIASFEKQRYRKLNFFQVFRYNSNEDFIP